MRFFSRFVSSLNSWKVVSWFDTPSENGCLGQLKVGFEVGNGLSMFLGNFLFTSSVERFSENFDEKAVTYLIFFVGTH